MKIILLAALLCLAATGDVYYSLMAALLTYILKEMLAAHREQ